MSTFLWNCVGKLSLALLSLRYRIKVEGLESLSPEHLKKKGGILFLPNHPALMDPLFLFLLLWPRFRMRPLTIEYIYRSPLLQIPVKLVKAISIPNFDTSVNQLKIKRANEAIQLIAEGLKKGENFLFYPSGKLKNTGKEILGGASGVQGLLQECPETNVVLIRTTGLWGSSFSRALEGRSPNLQKTLIKNLWALLKNFIFFLPRRRVLIEIAPAPNDLPVHSRLDLNRALENWYNRYPDGKGSIREIEPLNQVSYSFWRYQVPPVYRRKRAAQTSQVEIADATRDKIYEAIRLILNRPDLEIKPEMNLALDLGMDSLNVAELIAFVAKNFKVGELHPDEFETVQSAMEIADGVQASEHPARSDSALFHWPEEKNRPNPALPVGRTLQEAFLNSCQRMGSFTACADDMAGPISYKKLKLAALVLSQRFRKLEGRHVGVLLPASLGTYITIFALQLAGKVPVMLNWTLGPRYLDEMARLGQIETVLSSWRFLDRLAHVEFGNCIDKFLLLEDIRASLTLKEKLKGALLSRASNSYLIRHLKLDQIDPDEPAVILFTSGTEAKPKGVPLSHKNILSNERSAMQCIEFVGKDVIYGVLPPFHSFGFSVAGTFPVLAGLKIAFYPDPTDSFALAEGIARWKVTVFCSPPSFMKGLFHAAQAQQLKTVRYFVCGAERTPIELYEKVEQLGTQAHLLEGYGITECSPILSLNSSNLPSQGVGRLLPDIEMCTIHPETKKLLEPGAEGEICVIGPNVFKGYLGSTPSPFIEIDGRSWYRTGDLGYLSKEGNLILSGRLKRFTKFGGEMISLGAIEETLLHALQKAGEGTSEGAVLAVCADERGKGQPQLIVFTTLNLTIEKANAILQEAGFSRLIKISDIRRVEMIPLMGSGKIDYRTLQSTIIG